MKLLRNVISIFLIVISLNLVLNCSFCEKKENGYWYAQYTIWKEASDNSNNNGFIKQYQIGTMNPVDYEYSGNKKLNTRVGDTQILASLLNQEVDGLNEKETLYYIYMLNLFFKDWGKVDDNSEANIYKDQINQFKNKLDEITAKYKKGDYDKYKSKDKIKAAIKAAKNSYKNSKNNLDERAEQEEEALNGDAGESGGITVVELPERKLGYSDLSVASKETNVDETIDEANNFIGKAQTDKINQSDLSKSIKSLYNILLAIAIAVAVIVGTYIAVKIVTSSAEGKAKIKEMFLPYVIGCIVSFGAFGIWALVMKMFNTM